MSEIEKSLREIAAHNAEEVDRLRAEVQRLGQELTEERDYGQACDKIITSLRAATQWRPIESDLPPSGGWVDVVLAPDNGCAALRLTDVFYDAEEARWFDGRFRKLEGTPTHWMYALPLPPPPAINKENADE